MAQPARAIALLSACRCCARRRAGQQNFPSDDEEAATFYTDLMSGVPANATLCPQHWAWFRIPTKFMVPHTQLARSAGAGGPPPPPFTGNGSETPPSPPAPEVEGAPEWTQQQRAEIMTTSLSVMLDAGYDDVNNRFTTLSFIAVNGTPPSDTFRADPYDDAAYANIHHHYFEYTDRETLTFGFNDTFGGACVSPLADVIYFGIRCQHPLGTTPGPCKYNLTVTALPHALRNGMRFDGYLKPVESAEEESARHYFRVELSKYERLQIDIDWQGDGRPLHDAAGCRSDWGWREAPTSSASPSTRARPTARPRCCKCARSG